MGVIDKIKNDYAQKRFAFISADILYQLYSSMR